MATSNTSDAARTAIFNRLDEIFSGADTGTADFFSASPTANAIGTATSISGNTSDKAYRKIVAHGNVTSNSKLQGLHECPRRYELGMLRASSGAKDVDLPGPSTVVVNYDFAYGHAVGAGIQTYAATGSLVAAQFAAFTAWRAPYDQEKTDKNGKPAGKSIHWALLAVEKFAWFYQQHLSEWEVLTLPNGKPAVELSFAVDTANGYFHVGHIDTILQHKESKRLAVWEGKTTGLETVDEAAYANSYQALGYSVVVDAISKELGLPGSDYEVFYIVYSSKTREFTLMPFPKNRAQRAEWLQDLLITHSVLAKYEELEFYPKRGDSCVNKWGRKCEWFGTCQMRNSSLFPRVVPPKLQTLADFPIVDYTFTLAELVAAQREKS